MVPLSGRSNHFLAERRNVTIKILIWSSRVPQKLFSKMSKISVKSLTLTYVKNVMARVWTSLFPTIFIKDVGSDGNYIMFTKTFHLFSYTYYFLTKLV
jgi:hypothetical protein